MDCNLFASWIRYCYSQTHSYNITYMILPTWATLATDVFLGYAPLSPTPEWRSALPSRDPEWDIRNIYQRNSRSQTWRSLNCFSGDGCLTTAFWLRLRGQDVWYDQLTWRAVALAKPWALRRAVLFSVRKHQGDAIKVSDIAQPWTRRELFSASLFPQRS